MAAASGYLPSENPEYVQRESTEQTQGESGKSGLVLTILWKAEFVIQGTILPAQKVPP
jgi:hypothetical protein